MVTSRLVLHFNTDKKGIENGFGQVGGTRVNVAIARMYSIFCSNSDVSSSQNVLDFIEAAWRDYADWQVYCDNLVTLAQKNQIFRERKFQLSEDTVPR